MKQCLVSACLTGLCTRYDGQSKAHPECLEFLKNYMWLPVCPEQLGGLPTPRPPANLIGGDGHAVLAGSARVLDNTGQDLTAPFIRGAYMVLNIAQAQQIELCLLKARSPSCGCGEKPGVTAALLAAQGIHLMEF